MHIDQLHTIATSSPHDNVLGAFENEPLHTQSLATSPSQNRAPQIPIRLESITDPQRSFLYRATTSIIKHPLIVISIFSATAMTAPLWIAFVPHGSGFGRLLSALMSPSNGPRFAIIRPNVTATDDYTSNMHSDDLSYERYSLKASCTLPTRPSQAGHTIQTLEPVKRRKYVFKRARTKSIKLSFAIVLAFVVCWSPYYIVYFLRSYQSPMQRIDPRDPSIYSFFFGHLNAVINPVICGVFHRKTKTSFFNQSTPTVILLKRLSTILLHFTRRSTMHGLNHLAQARSAKRRIFWFLISTLATIGFFVNLFYLVEKSFQTPVLTNTFHDYTSFVYPDITFCLVNPINFPPKKFKKIY